MYIDKEVVMDIGEFTLGYLDKRKKQDHIPWSARCKAVDLLGKTGMLSLDMSGLEVEEIPKALDANYELADFVAWGLSITGRPELADYCAFKMQTTHITDYHGESNRRRHRPTYDSITNRVIENLRWAIDAAWAREDVQKRIFPNWYAKYGGYTANEYDDPRYVKDIAVGLDADDSGHRPMHPTILYGCFNACARRLSPRSAYQPEQIPLGVS